ncbi:MAG: Cdc6/Cdc18 family protein [Candidatus Kariarchaeaceae archaeon]
MGKNNIDLDEIFDRYHSPKVAIFKERETLRATYVPESLPHRDKEIQSLANILGPIMRGESPSNAFLYGKPGSGKTVVVKFVIKFLHNKAETVGVDFQYAFINCQMIDTAYRVYASLCDSIGVEVPTTGLPTDKIISLFSENLDRQATHFTIILDEIDLLMRKDSKTLYNLTRMNTDLINAKVSIIGVTNNVQFKESIDARIRSTLTEQEIVFSPYTTPQLKDILTERAKTGFEEGVVDQSAIERASALAASEHGDARRALDLLRVAGEVAESGQESKVDSTHVKRASDVIETDTVAEVLISLPIHSKCVLFAISVLDTQRANDKKSNDMVTTGEVYKKYAAVCRQLLLDDLTQRRVGDLINELDVLGMIRASVISKGRYGRTRVISLAVQPLEIHKALQKDQRIAEVLPPIENWMN